MVSLCCLLLSALHALPAAAEITDVHFMIPGGAGSGWDTTARGAGRVLRQTDLVKNASFENISGAGGGRAIGTLIETAERRGNTLMVNSTPIIVRSLTRIFPYSFRDLTPVARIIGDYQVLVTRPDSSLQDFNEVLRRFRENPRSIKIAGGSVRGDLDHLVPALALRAAGENPGKLAYVPYDGGGKALAGFLAGEGDLLSTGLSEALSYHRAGKLKIIAVSAPQKIVGLEELATFIDQGVNFEFVNWRGFFAAPGIDVAAADDYANMFREMQMSDEWEELRSRNGWQNLYLARVDFVRFLEKQEQDIRDLMLQLGFLREGTQ
jgi:putative tricarboxylic transport membrane protein